MAVCFFEKLGGTSLAGLKVGIEGKAQRMLCLYCSPNGQGRRESYGTLEGSPQSEGVSPCHCNSTGFANPVA